MSEVSLVHILEALLLASSKPMTIDKLRSMFGDDGQPNKGDIKTALQQLQQANSQAVMSLVKVAGGYRYQIKAIYTPWISRLYKEKPQKYSRALLETLALIAYRQPITRAEIEVVRGVSVSSYIIKTLTERQWIRVIGHRDVPGKPALLATTPEFLQYFNLNGLSDLPALNDLRDLSVIQRELALEDVILPLTEK